jgi:hypothetical protein
MYVRDYQGKANVAKEDTAWERVMLRIKYQYSIEKPQNKYSTL